ncbi:MAG: hypothetical protein MUC60_10250 [Oscillatoria sp. Prado101]|nr:hypothetical protein [Oscillatoria sp. Prado101]
MLRGRKKLWFSLAASVAITGISFASPVTPTNFINQARAQQALISGGTASGEINANSRSFTDAETEKSRFGEEYTFEGKEEDTVTIEVQPTGALEVKLVLIDPRGNIETAGSDGEPELKDYTLKRSGTYKVRVLASSGTGRYTIRLTSSNTGTVTAEDVFKRYGWNSVICGSPDLAVIQIGSETRCTRDYPKGRYTYNLSTGKLDAEAIPDSKPLADKVMDMQGLATYPCGADPTKLVVFTIGNETRCMIPKGEYAAGSSYTFDTASNKFKQDQQPVNANSNPVPPSDPNIALIKSWELTPVDCVNGGPVVLISIDGKNYCTAPAPQFGMTAGQSYQYNRATGALIPVSGGNNNGVTEVKDKPW